MAGAWTIRVAATSTGASQVCGVRSGPGDGSERRQLLAQIAAVAVWALWRWEGLAYQFFELLTAGGARVFVDGHDFAPENYSVV